MVTKAETRRILQATIDRIADPETVFDMHNACACIIENMRQVLGVAPFSHVEEKLTGLPPSTISSLNYANFTPLTFDYINEHRDIAIQDIAIQELKRIMTEYEEDEPKGFSGMLESLRAELEKCRETSNLLRTQVEQNNLKQQRIHDLIRAAERYKDCSST